MRRLVCVALAFACIGLPAVANAASPVPDLATLLAKIAAANGPEPVNYRDAFTVKTPNGDTGVVHLFSIGPNFRTTSDVGAIHAEYGRIGGEWWNQNPNGLTVVDEPEPTDLPITSNDFHESTASTVQLSGSNDTGIIISDVGKNGLGTRRYIDPTTYLTMRFERIGRAGTTTVAYEDYEQAGSQHVPSHYTVTYPSGHTYTVTRGERVLGDVTSAQVTEPATRRALVDFPDGKPAEIPSYYHAGEYFIHATINGHRAELLLATGVAGIVLDTATAKSFGLTPVDRVSAANATDPDFYSTIVKTIGLGTAGMHDIVIDTAPVSFRETWSSQVVGFIGFDFLATIGLTIDNEHQRLTATPFSTYTPPSGPNVMAIDIRLGRRVPMATVTLDHAVADRFVVDTADAIGTYTVFDYFMDKYPHVGTRSSLYATGIGYHSEPITFHQFSVHTFHFGAYDFNDFNGSSVGAGHYASPVDGALGTLFLVLFNIDFDYPHGRMYLTPTTNTKQMLHIH